MSATLAIDLELHPQQFAALDSLATEILFGGAAGGGKSHLKRVAAIAMCIGVPGLRVCLVRREYPDLKANHFDGRSSLPAMLAPWIAAKLVRYNISDLSLTFSNGSRIIGKHFQRESDYLGFQGDEYDLLLVDELTHFSDFQYRYLRSRCRTAGLVVPPGVAWTFPRILCSSNPGGPGHTWVKGTFIDPQPPLTLWQAAPDDGGMVRQFIPARLVDNPSVNRADYEGKLQGLGNPALVKAMLDGDWNVVAGGMLDDVWREDVHAIEPFAIPPGWTVTRSFDWGSSKPFSVCWWAESDGTEVEITKGVKRSWPKGTLFHVAEWYGWNGKANEGARMLAVDIARGILEREKQMGYSVRPGPADTAIFDTQNGVCIASDMERIGVRWERAQKGPGSRVNGWERVRQVLAASLKFPMEEPGLFVFKTCRQFVRTVPTLPRDPTKSDDVDTDAEDHIGDALRYRLSMSDRRAGTVDLP